MSDESATEKAIGRPRPARTALLCLLALAPIWIAGMFGRAYWTPDEPRERAVTLRMLRPDSQLSIPTLAGTPILEKPPAYYWLAAASDRIVPWFESAPRLPNLLYAALGMLATFLWARSAGVKQHGWLVAIVCGSFALAYQVAIRLATDALLVACVSIALAGAYRGYTSTTRSARLRAYLVMHIAAACGFLAKGPIALVLPALALLSIIVWERRWRELRRPELWAGLILQFGIIGAWVWAVVRLPAGSTDLKVMLWYNLIGRFISMPAIPGTLPYVAEHPSWPGKYLSELPFYLLPWSALAIAALRRAWRAARLDTLNGTAWRFAAGYILAATAVLSLSASGRGIYYAPLLPAYAVLIGLWAEGALEKPDAFERRMLSITNWLVAVVVALASITVTLAWAAKLEQRYIPGFALLIIAAGAWYAARRKARAAVDGAALARLYAAFAASLLAVAIVIFPIIDRSQDLVSVARRLDVGTAGRDRALLFPDETTIAMFDVATTGPEWPMLTSADEVRAFSAKHPHSALIGLLPDKDFGPLRTWLARHAKSPREKQNSTAASLAADQVGLKVDEVFAAPDGRQYAVWSSLKPHFASTKATPSR